MSYFHRVVAQTRTRFWINNVTREQALLALEHGATGCTQNPSFSYKMLVHPQEGEYARRTLREILAQEPDDSEAMVKLQRALVGEVAKLFLPLYKQTGGQLGYVSIQGDPFDESYENILEKARFNREAGSNVMIKIPVTDHGLEAIEQCVREGIPLNCTEVMSVQQAVDVLDAYDRGAKGNDHPPVVYISHIAGIFDQYLSGLVKAQGVAISSDALWHAGKLVAQKIRAYMDERHTPVRLINGGARGLHHFTEWVGGNVSNTINWTGTADKLIEQNLPVVRRFDEPIPHAVLDELVNKLPDFERAYFTGRLTPEAYESFGPVELFCSGFRRDWSGALKIIAEEREAL